MIDEIDYFPKRDKYKKKKGVDTGEEWDALKKTKTGQDEKVKSKAKKDGKNKPEKKEGPGPVKGP